MLPIFTTARTLVGLGIPGQTLDVGEVVLLQIEVHRTRMMTERATNKTSGNFWTFFLLLLLLPKLRLLQGVHHDVDLEQLFQVRKGFQLDPVESATRIGVTKSNKREIN